MRTCAGDTICAMTPLLSVQDLSLDYGPTREGTVPVLQNASLSMEPGEIVGLLGPSGCGKTSLLRCILGVPAPDARIRCAALRFEDRDLLSMSMSERRVLRFRRMGFIFQDPAGRLSPFRRVRSQLADLLPSTATRADLLHALAGAGFSDPERTAAAYPHQLSGGEAQRVAIAQALAAQPSLLLADEPSSALDTVTQRHILDLLLRLRALHRTAMLIVSHDPALLAAIADRILTLQGGVLADYRPSLASRSTPPAHADHSPAAPLLQVRHLQFAHATHRLWPRTTRSTPILRQVSLDLAPGESLAIVGASGSGKSTLACCLAGIESRYSGEILFAGASLDLPRSLASRARIQLVLQDTVGALNPRLTIAEILAEPLRIHARSLSTPRNVAERIRQMLAAVTLPATYLTRRPPQLSGGERQRVAIARALMLQPSLLLLDEALTGLDRALQDSILALLDQLRAHMHLACLHFTHDLGRFLRSADRIALLHQGRIVECHPAADFARRASHPAALQLLHAILPDPCQL